MWMPLELFVRRLSEMVQREKMLLLLLALGGAVFHQ
jgi:hypothetical protein